MADDMKRSINALKITKKMLTSIKNDVINIKTFKNMFNKQSLDAIKFAERIIGRKWNVVINSNIFDHNYDYPGLLDKSMDIIEIFGNEDKEIELDDIIDVFKKMQRQFDEMDKKGLNNRSYYYEGIFFDHDEQKNRECYGKNVETYKIIWGS